ncbi:MAG: hypothetical protein U0807_05645 [Candidatus Binatia bacterium]
MPARGLLVLGALLALGCAPRPLIVQAVRARGGPLHSLVREVDAQVHAGFALGSWEWRTAFMVPDQYAWTIATYAEPNHYLFDGTTMRSFMGVREVAAEAEQAAPLRSHARFTAVVNLDALLLPGVQLAPLAAASLPPGLAMGLEAVFADDGARYRLGFDAGGLLAWASGPLVVPPFGLREATVRFGEFRPTGRWTLPYSAAYSFGGEPLADEHVRAACPDDPRLSADAFRRPGLVPPCGGNRPG